MYHPLAEDKGIALTRHIPDHCLFYGDIRMIQRMIANLLDNAIKYTPREGRVHISLDSSAEKSVIIAIQDTGTGISEEDLPHIFERFFRGNPSRPQTGFGLGLSLARAIANAHSSKINVRSRHHNGSTFTITLPKSPRNSSS